MVARIARIEAVVCDSAHEAAWLERNLLRASRAAADDFDVCGWARAARLVSPAGSTGRNDRDGL
jgi:hypothetical protein